MKKLGLIGFPLGHSFSKKYYLDKFQKENINTIDYDLYPLADISAIEEIINDHNFVGLNVTIPYKIDVMKYLDELSEEANEIQAVNCIQFIQNEHGKPYLKGFNTDVYGFQKSLEPLLEIHHQQALILGNGGAAKAVVYALKKLNIDYKFVSRTKTDDNFSYTDLSADIINAYSLIINCSPIGTYPNIEQAPDIPYQFITAKHLLYDLVYNPEETAFLRHGKEKGAKIKNGYEMLVLQAEKNWDIWNEIL